MVRGKGCLELVELEILFLLVNLLEVRELVMIGQRFEEWENGQEVNWLGQLQIMKAVRKVGCQSFMCRAALENGLGNL